MYASCWDKSGSIYNPPTAPRKIPYVKEGVFLIVQQNPFGYLRDIIKAMERRINIRGIVSDDNGHVLAVKHRDRNTTGESDFWAIPGGGLDSCESLDDGLVREFVEELGIKPQIGRLLFMQQFIFTHRNGNQSEKMELFFHATSTVDFQHDIDLSATSHGHELVRVAFIDPATSDLLPDFLQKVDIRNHIDTNQPVLFVNNLQKSSR
jgi:8-oxo-dGTP pyrophosphatase MutT (NUDIX family)